MHCPNCGNKIEEGAKFCNNCGTALEIPTEKKPEDVRPAPVNNTGYVRYGEEPASSQQPIGVNPYEINSNANPADTQYQPNQTPYGTGAQQPYYQNVPAQPKKSNKGCLIAILVVIGLIVLSVTAITIAGVFAGKNIVDDFAENDFSINFDIDDFDNPSAKGEDYSKGEVENGVYINKWAGLMLVIPSDFEEKSASDYDSMESEDLDCGLYISNENYDSLSITFFKADEYDMDIYDYSDELASVIKNSIEENDENYTLEENEESSSFAGKSCLKRTLVETLSDYTIADTLYIFEIDGYYGCVWITGDSLDYNDDLAAKISAYAEG